MDAATATATPLNHATARHASPLWLSLCALALAVLFVAAPATARAQETWPEPPGLWDELAPTEDRIVALAEHRYVRVLIFPVKRVDEDGDTVQPALRALRASGLDLAHRERLTFWVRDHALASLWRVEPARPGPHGSRFVEVVPGVDDVAVVLGPEPTRARASAFPAPAVEGFYRPPKWLSEIRRIGEVLARRQREWEDVGETPARIEFGSGVWLTRVLERAVLAHPHWFVEDDVPMSAVLDAGEGDADVEPLPLAAEVVPWSLDPVVRIPAGATVTFHVPAGECVLRLTVWQLVPDSTNPYSHVPLDTELTVGLATSRERRLVDIDSRARALRTALTESRTLTRYVAPTRAGAQRVTLRIGDGTADAFIRATTCRLRPHWLGLYRSISPLGYLRSPAVITGMAAGELSTADVHLHGFLLGLDGLPPRPVPERATPDADNANESAEPAIADSARRLGVDDLVGWILDLAHARAPSDDAGAALDTAWRPPDLAAWLAGIDDTLDRALATAEAWDLWFDQQGEHEFWVRGAAAIDWARGTLGSRFATRTASGGAGELRYWNAQLPKRAPDFTVAFNAIPTNVDTPNANAGDVRLVHGATYESPPPILDADGHELGFTFWTVAELPGVLLIEPLTLGATDNAGDAGAAEPIALQVPAGIGEWRLADLPARFRVHVPEGCDAFADVAIGFPVDAPAGLNPLESPWPTPDRWGSDAAWRTLYRRAALLQIPAATPDTIEPDADDRVSPTIHPLEYAWPPPPTRGSMRLTVARTDTSVPVPATADGTPLVATLTLTFEDGTTRNVVYWPDPNAVVGDALDLDPYATHRPPAPPAVTLPIPARTTGVIVHTEPGFPEPVLLAVELQRARKEWRDRARRADAAPLIRIGEPAPEAATPTDDDETDDENGDLTESDDGNDPGAVDNDNDADSDDADDADVEDSSDGSGTDLPAEVIEVLSPVALMHAPGNVFVAADPEALLAYLRDLTARLHTLPERTREHALVRLARLRLMIALRAQSRAAVEVGWFHARLQADANALPQDIAHAARVYEADLWLDAGYTVRAAEILELDPTSLPLLLRAIRAQAARADLDKVLELAARIGDTPIPDDVAGWLTQLIARARLLTWDAPDPFPKDALAVLVDENEQAYWRVRRRLAAGDLSAIADARALAEQPGLPLGATERLIAEADLLEALPVMPRTPARLERENRELLARWYATADWWRFTPLGVGFEIRTPSGALRLQTVDWYSIGAKRWRIGPAEPLVIDVVGPMVLRLRVRGLDPDVIAAATQQARAALLARIARGEIDPDVLTDPDAWFVDSESGIDPGDVGPGVRWHWNGQPQTPLPILNRPSQSLFATVRRDVAGRFELADPVARLQSTLIELGPGRHRITLTADVDVALGLDRLEPGTAQFVRRPTACADFDTFAHWSDANAPLATEPPRLLDEAARCSYPWPLASSHADARFIEPEIASMRDTMDEVEGVRGLALIWGALKKRLALPHPDYSAEGWRQLARAIGRSRWTRSASVKGEADTQWVIPAPAATRDRSAHVNHALLPPDLRGSTITLAPGQFYRTQRFPTALQYVRVRAFVVVRDRVAWNVGTLTAKLQFDTTLGREINLIELRPGVRTDVMILAAKGRDPQLTLTLEGESSTGGTLDEHAGIRVEVLLDVVADDPAQTTMSFPDVQVQRWHCAIENVGVTWEVPGGSILRVDAVHDLPIVLKITIDVDPANPETEPEVHLVPLPRPPALVEDAARRPRTSLWFSVPGEGPVRVTVEPAYEFGDGPLPMLLPVRCYIATPPPLLFAEGARRDGSDPSWAHGDDDRSRPGTSPWAQALANEMAVDRADYAAASSRVVARLDDGTTRGLPDWQLRDPALAAEPTGTAPWDLALSFGMRSGQHYEDVDTLSPRDFVGVVRLWYPVPSFRLYLSASLEAIVTDIPDVLVRLRARAYWIPFEDVPAFSVELNGYWLLQFMHERLGLDPGDRLLSGILFLRLGPQYRFDVARGFDVQFGLYYIQRIVNPETPSVRLQTLLDSRVWTPWKIDHSRGLELEFYARYVPVVDVNFFVFAWLLTNDDLIGMERIRWRFGARQFVGPFDFQETFTHAHYFVDQDRVTELDRFDIEVEASVRLWTQGGDYWRFYASVAHRIDRADILIAAGFEFTFGTGGTFRHMDRESVRFRTPHGFDLGDD